jgi:hypothetical protein
VAAAGGEVGGGRESEGQRWARCSRGGAGRGDLHICHYNGLALARKPFLGLTLQFCHCYLRLNSK